MGRIELSRAATRGELEKAIADLTDADLARIQKYAKFKALQIGCDHRELMNEVIVAIANPEERRRWEQEKVSFLHLVLGTIRSMASSWAKAASRRRNEETELSLDTDRAQFEAQSSDRRTNPEWMALQRQMVGEIRAHFSDDELVSEIIDGLSAGMTRRELIELLSVEPNVYDAAVKRLRRTVGEMFPDERAVNNA